MATAVPTPPSPDTLHTPISSESAVGGSESGGIASFSSSSPSSSIQQQHFQFQQQHPRQEQTRQIPSRQTKRMSTTSVDAGSGTGAGTGTGGERQKRKSRTSIGAVSVVKIEPVSASTSRRQSASLHSLKRTRSKSRSPPRRVSASGIEVEIDIGHHTQELTFELEGRRVSLSSVTGPENSVGGNGSVSTGAVTPKDRLPPSPPLTRVGSNDSIRLSSGKRSRRASKRKSVDAKPTGGINNEAHSNMELPPDGDISSQDIRAYQQENGDEKPHGAHTQIEDDNRKLIQSQSAEDGTDPNVSARPIGAEQAAFATSSSRPSSPAAPSPIGVVKPGGVRHVLDHPMYNSYDAVGLASSSTPRPLALRSRASEAKLTGQLSPLPSPTRDHPLYRPPSPQPWDLVQPPPENNAVMNGNDVVDGYPFATGTGRSGKTGTTGTLEGREGSLKSDAFVAEKDVVVKDGKRYRVPRSSYYFGPPPDTSAFGTAPIGQLGIHHPREIVRIERDYSGGELCQFSSAYPLELEGRLTPTQFLETVNIINESLISAHSLKWSCLDNVLAIFTLYLSRLLIKSHYERELERLKKRIEELNRTVYNTVGLNILWPKNVAFMFLEIEYY